MNTTKGISRGATEPRPAPNTMRLHQLVTMTAAFLVLLFLTTPARAQSALDGFDPNCNGSIRVAVVQPDGKILIGGDFTALSPNGGVAVTRNHIARLNPNGTLDTTFNPNANGSVYCIAVQADGKILAGGLFTSIGGQTRSRLARLDAATGIADSFSPDANHVVRSLVVQADGKILAGGVFTDIGGQPRNRIARLDPATGLADSFNPNANDAVYSIALQRDGKIVAGGLFRNIGGQSRNRIARIDATTGLADSFDPRAGETIGIVHSVAVQADARILIGGSFSTVSGVTRKNIARINTDGTLDMAFNPDAENYVLSVTVQPDGKILAGGNFTSIGGQPRIAIARLEAATGLADSFAPNGNWNVYSIAVQGDGKILAAGDFTTLSPNGGAAVTRNRIARLETDGRVDQTLTTFINGLHVDVTTVQPDGKILVGGWFYNVSDVPRTHLARLNTDGTLDTAFDPPFLNSGVQAIAVQTDGKILVGGDFESVNGLEGLIRLEAATGALDNSFRPSPINFVYAIAVQSDGKILVGGGSTSGNFLSRLNPDGPLDATFNPNTNGGAVFSIVLQADGKILLGGSFTSVSGQVRNRIARVNSDGTVDLAFDPNANGDILSIAVQADGKILAGGGFTSIGGQTRYNIARLDATTGAADSFDPHANYPVRSIVVQADSKILVGGEFWAEKGASIGGQPRNRIARLDPTTGLADSFNPNVNSYVQSIAVQADGKILAGGFFGGANSIGGQQRFNFARLSNDTAALQNLSVTPFGITWTRAGSSPQFTRVTFESSADNVQYTPLGNGAAAGSNWTLTGLHLPTEQNFYIRARGYYRCGHHNGSESVTESVRRVFIFRPSTLGNISTRLRVQTGDNAMIGGFIITGTEPKTVIVRGIGPSLPIAGALADPVIEVYGSAGQLLATNDNWNDSLTRQQIIDSGLAPANDLESALWGTIDPGSYTVVVRGHNNSTGVGLFEVYDLDRTADSKLANISTRGLVETDDSVMIGGTIILGDIPARVLLRAIGPSLTNFGVPNALHDPTLELRDGNGGLIAANNNWRSDQEAEIIATGLSPSNNVESAIVRDLLPGNYTAIVRGINNTTGTALIEAYNLN